MQFLSIINTAHVFFFPHLIQKYSCHCFISSYVTIQTQGYLYIRGLQPLLTWGIVPLNMMAYDTSGQLDQLFLPLRKQPV